MQYRILEPAELMDDGASILIMPNHLGASINDDMGPKAQTVADITGRRTLTYDRRASGDRATWNLLERRALTNDYVGSVAFTGRVLAKILAEEGAVETHIAAQSAAGVEGTTLVRTETLPVNRLTCMDSAGMQTVWVPQGFGDWLRYFHKEHRAKTPTCWPNKKQPSDRTPHASRVAAQTKHGLAELWVHANVYSKPIARDNLLYIARRMPGVAMHVLSVDNTFTLPPHHASELGRALVEARGRAPGENKAQVETRMLPDTYHSHFDPAETYAGYVLHTYDMPVVKLNA